MCRSHATVRELLASLVAGYEGLAVLDLEAGLENFSRGTPRHAHTLLIVLEPYFKSLETGRRIQELARELNIPRVLGIANKVRTADDAAAIRRFAESRGIEVAAVVPNDDMILEADRRGQSPADAVPDSPACRVLREFATTL